MASTPLKTDFPEPSLADWQDMVTHGLRGGNFEILQRQTEDGIARGPLMSADDLPQNLTALARSDVPLLDERPWHIAAPVRDPDLAHANQQLLDDLKGGASAVRIELGVEIADRNDLKRVLEGVFTDLVPLTFTQGAKVADAVISVNGFKAAQVNLGLDPLRDADGIKDALKTSPDSWRVMALNPAAIHEAGGTDVQELAGMAAALADAMRRHGGTITAKHLIIHVAADRDAHLSIAKFRAARRLTLHISKAFGADGNQIPIHAVTSQRMMQTVDPWTNLLRVMSAGFGAVIGGAEFVTTRPFTDGLGHATPFAHRIARNMQLMMMEESHLGQVSDPAHGSFWHERLTEDLALAAWTEFQRIEGLGGIETYLSSGQNEVDLKASKVARAERDEPILGVTLHPAKDEQAPEVRS